MQFITLLELTLFRSGHLVCTTHKLSTKHSNFHFFQSMTLTQKIIFLTSFTVLPILDIHAQDAALETQKQAGQQTYMMVCFACHQPTGLGLLGMFPPLANSDWITTKKPDRLIRVALHGLTGPITINGKPFPTPAPIMPAQGMLTDEQVANVLTYIRNTFGNVASAVSPSEVTAIRTAEAARVTPWTEAELLQIPAE